MHIAINEAERLARSKGYTGEISNKVYLNGIIIERAGEELYTVTECENNVVRIGVR